MINVAILGYGTVGGGVAEVLKTNAASIAKRVGEELNIKYILDIREFPGDPFENIITKDFDAIVADADVKVVCETMGGLKPAYDFTKKLPERAYVLPIRNLWQHTDRNFLLLPRQTAVSTYSKQVSAEESPLSVRSLPVLPLRRSVRSPVF